MEMEKTCPVCGKEYGRPQEVKRHFWAKHEGIRLHCYLCDAQFSYLGDLNRHLKSIHDGIQYPCDECDQKCTTLSNLNKHKEKHHQDGLFSIGSMYQSFKKQQSAVSRKARKLRKSKSVSVAKTGESEAFSKAAVKVFHEKPKPTHEKPANQKPNLIQQPRK